MNDRIEKRLGRPLTPQESDALLALELMADLAGARAFGIAWGTESGPASIARWYAFAIFTGERLNTPDVHEGPASAATALGLLLMGRLRCSRCGRQLSDTPAEGRCHWVQDGADWIRQCAAEEDAEPAPAPGQKEDTDA